MIESEDRILHGERTAQRLQELIERDPEVRTCVPRPEVKQQARAGGLSLADVIDVYLTGYHDRAAMGERDYEIVLQKGTGRQERVYKKTFKTTTYGELQARIRSVANVWRHVDAHRVSPDEFVCIMGFASVDFAVLDMACAFAHAVTVPLQSTTSGADLKDILETIEPVTLAATVDDLEVATAHAVAQPSIRSIIVFDLDAEDGDHQRQLDVAQSLLQSSGSAIQLITLDQVIEQGNQYPWERPPPHAEGDERMAAIIHSSGSTGTPKGAVLKETMLKFIWTGPDLQEPPSISVLFSPLNHLIGRNAMITVLRRGRGGAGGV